MKDIVPTRKSRRHFLETTASILTGVTVAPSLIAAPNILKHYNQPNSLINGVQIGVITYSFRSMPDQSAEATLQYVLDSGISAIELMGDPAESFAGKPESSIDRRAFFRLARAQRNGEELTQQQQAELADMQAQMKSYNQEVAKWRSNVSLDKFTQLRKMYSDAGVSIYAFKPNAFGKDNTDAEINYGMQAAKALGASHITLEHPSDDAHTQRLGKLAKKHKMYVAYHGHEQQTPTFWDTALEQSKYNALNLDIGHYVAAGNPKPLEIVEAKHDRIMSMHIKDRETPAQGKENLPWGEGDTPITEVLQLMHNNKYAFPATIELEYQIPDGSDAVKEVAKCLEYCRTALT
jgi:sugar phosphate isomerase/epimerase